MFFLFFLTENVVVPMVSSCCERFVSCQAHWQEFLNKSKNIDCPACQSPGAALGIHTVRVLEPLIALLRDLVKEGSDDAPARSPYGEDMFESQESQEIPESD